MYWIAGRLAALATVGLTEAPAFLSGRRRPLRHRLPVRTWMPTVRPTPGT